MGLTLRVEDFVTIEQVVEQQLWGFLSENVETLVETYFWSTVLFSKAYTLILLTIWITSLPPLWLCEISTNALFVVSGGSTERLVVLPTSAADFLSNVEELINNGQTQRTEQTLASCTTVRTEYTASASTEDNYSTSDTISSSPSEVQLSFNTSLSLTATSSNNYPIPEIYDESLLEKDFSDEEIELPTNSLSERNYINPNLNLLEIYDPKACYNKFLYYHRLQTLPSPQTVGSFLHYIQEYYPMFYSNQYIKISIKPHSRFDNIFTEAHIYLPYENFIPDHIIFPPLEDLLYYSDIELKSPNNKFQTPIFTDTSLNTNGLLQPTKKLLIEETLNQNLYDIFGLSETHLTQKDGKFLNNKIKNYTSFWSSFSNLHQAGNMDMDNMDQWTMSILSIFFEWTYALSPNNNM
ncbi:hypothetical protein C2G38_2231364 [Gigaspora rosea]|uniref:Uncharacterized protein n=1 Tax=Gigaspora rosea TaxID=44941 RepID=A0A397TTX9_9GLOM|nr:hypothetical protein C2G38_2231364 [Gigaspora rosea]